MSRNQTCSAIVLKTYRIAEIHLGVNLFTREHGLVSAIAHGARSAKGRLRGLTDPFCLGSVYLYTDPVRNSVKITEFDVQDFFLGLRENIRRFYTASLWAEIVLKSYGGGESSEQLFDLFVAAMQRIETATDEQIPLVSVQFLTRYLAMVGTFPQTDECGSCGRRLADGRSVRYSATRETFVCLDCAGPDMLELPIGALRYLDHTLSLPIANAFGIKADQLSVSAILRLLYALVGSLVETPLSTLEIGRGIL
ncbi:MAG TPA: DNA repair protein RecO [Spirochaetia bacterium]|nr:DNA repair protein RecO [Spirochaetia bacterium]